MARPMVGGKRLIACPAEHLPDAPHTDMDMSGNERDGYLWGRERYPREGAAAGTSPR